MLEKLNLYYNRIPSLEEVKVLCKLPALKELDLRLNPLTRRDPHYRLCLIHAMSSLRKLDDCPVRDTERKVAIMQFPSDCVPQQSSLPLNLETEQRVSYSGTTGSSAAASHQKADKHKRGSYRKPLKLLLNLVDEHWAGERSLHQNNHFLSKAVQILSMMEDDLSVQEGEVTTLRQEVAALRHGAELREKERQVEIMGLSSHLEEAQGAVGQLNEQLRVVLEENVGLQKQLIKLEQQYLKSLMKVSPIAQIKAQTEVEELRREIEGLREKVQEAENVKELTDMLQESHR
ncbi:hypothetical protein NHX12_002122 [Muraenolepis orangiensis]|uniref:U2A'/phosphoprotein 32 family A C-terminal domain-containing protein n=1 Tax=Muraenolepis orangiensis TaxID=630683 RepID=A0A9Q0IFK6_9TELE|nr:hypothetical protein NHX12_002122 [Muraenolepis orangiensis]